jgi:hypothetical protein
LGMAPALIGTRAHSLEKALLSQREMLIFR